MVGEITGSYFLVTVLCVVLSLLVYFYRAMHFSAKRGIAIVCCPSVRLSVCPCVTFRYRDHIGWNSSKIISRPNSLGPLLRADPNMGDLVQREHPQN